MSFHRDTSSYSTAYKTVLNRNLFRMVENEVQDLIDLSVGTQTFSDGLITLPSITFTDDTNLGLYRVGSDSLGVASNSALALNITETQTYFPSLNSQTNPAVSFIGDSDTGLYNSSPNNIGITCGGNVKAFFGTNRNQSYLPYAIPDGLESTPSLTWENDLDSGIFRIGADNVGISTGGTNRFDIDNNSINASLPILAPLGSTNAPGYSFFNDSNTGMFSSGGNILDWTLGGSTKLTLRGTDFRITNGITADFQRFNGGFGQHCIYSDTVDNFDFHMNSQTGNGRLNMRTYKFLIRNITTQTDAFAIRSDDELTDYYNIDTTGLIITSACVNHGPNGTALLPSYTFENFPTNGMYSTASSLLLFSVAGVLKMSLDTSTDSLVLSTQNILGPTDLNITNQLGEEITFNGVNETVDIRCGSASVALFDTDKITTTQPILAPNGTASNPAYSFSGATNHGMYHTGNDTVFVDAGNEMFRYSGSQIVMNAPVRLDNVATGGYGVGLAGQIQYSSTVSKVIYFDGSDWRRMDTDAIVS